MRKLPVLVFFIILTLSLVACSGEKAKPTNAPTTETPTTEMPTEEITEEATIEETTAFLFDYVAFDAEGMIQRVAPTEDMLFLQSLLNGLTANQVPDYYTIVELNADGMEYDIFTPYVDGMTAVRCEPAIHTHFPLSIVVLNVPDGTDVEAICADIEANANPKKWVCVEAEAVRVVSSGNTILLVMSNQETVETVVANFNANTSQESH